MLKSVGVAAPVKLWGRGGSGLSLRLRHATTLVQRVAKRAGGLWTWNESKSDASLASRILGASAGCVGLILATRTGKPACAEEECLDTETALSRASPRCKHFVGWVLAHGIDVVVFDMDLTMGGGHCGPGLPRDRVEEYIAQVSNDFVEAVRVLCRLPGIRLGVATNSDPVEYDLPGQSRETHILGPDLATALIERWCPEALPKFEIMVGFDPDLHMDMPKELGKSVHMRRVAAHYGAQFERMVLFDDSPRCLANTDGWQGVLVKDQRVGFRFEDCVDSMATGVLALPESKRQLMVWTR